MSKKSKAERKTERIEDLEMQLIEEKKKSKDAQKTIRLDDEQIEYVLDQITKRVEWQTRTMSEEIREKKMIVNVNTGNKTKWDAFSKVLRWLLSVLFFGFGVVMIAGLLSQWQSLWTGWAEKTAVILTGVIGVVCVLIGIDIHNEKDRNYLVALFSALVALVALIVALIK